MRNKRSKSIVSYVLVLLMILTALPSNTLQVNAATKPTLSASQITLTKGMTQTLKSKNVKKGSKVKWSSKNKAIATVNGKGVVKGIKDGKTTINCVVTSSGKKTSLKCTVTVKTPKFAQDTYSIVKGESFSPVLKNKYSKAKYKWSCQDENIAKVNSKGKVTGVEVGETTVTVKISIPKTTARSAKVITKKVAILVTDGELVTNQEELKKALSNQTIKKITIKTDQKVELTIPQGDYKSVELVVDAPKADIINNGVFKNITIKQIAADTWTEKAKGNVLILDAAAGHVVIPNTAGISEIRITNANSNFKLDVQGNVDKISIESPTKIDIKITGTVGTVDVNSRATVSVDGSSTAPIAIKVAEGADGTTLNSNVKVDVTSGSDTEINLSKGAEGSAVQTTNEKKSVEVTNNTSSKVEITNEAGKNQTVDSGKNATVDGSGTVTNSTTGNGSTSGGGGSSSGGGSGSYPGGDASSSGNLTRTVTSFQSIKAVEAGIYGTTLKTVDELVAMFPTTVTGSSIKGNVTFEVLSWTNTDNYAPETATAGYYKFTAVLGTASVPNIIKKGVEAYVNVWVKPSTDGLIFKNDYAGCQDKLTMTGYEECLDELQLKFNYTGTEYIRVAVELNYYDNDGDLIKQASDYWVYIDANSERIVSMPLPKNSMGKNVPYKSFTATVSTWSVDYISAKDKLVISSPSDIVTEYEYETYGGYSTTISIQNTGKAEIQEGRLAVYFWKGTEVVGIREISLSGIVGNETTTRKVWFGWDTAEGGTKVVPDSATIRYEYAHINNSDMTYEGEGGTLVFKNDYAGCQDKFTMTGYEECLDELQLKFNYTGTEYIRVAVELNYYDNDGDLIKQASDYWVYIDANSERIVSMPLPKNSMGKNVPYKSFTATVSTWSVDYISAKDKLVISSPSDIVTEYEYETYGGYSTTISIQNTGKAEIQEGRLAVYFWKGTEVVGIREISLSGIVGNETTTRKVWFGWDTAEGGTKVVPDGVTVRYEYAHIGN